ncbi:hypothetical protein Scep_020230 [Stephania cephalantha]|uniref:F-box domain-containing protein n=1 Tax=Stephania cephalantha TaxID=152367 RepID=A0AAP0IDB4_9MAGN
MEEETKKVACFGLQSKLTEDIIFEEILPRLPIKSIFRFKLVSQKWLNFITNDPLLPTHHSQKGPNTTNDITSSGLFCPRSQLFISSDDQNHQFKWNKPEFMTGQPVEVLGCCNGLIYGMLPGYLKIFIFNPITKHTVYAPNLLNHRPVGLVADPRNPSLGFTILAMHNDKRKFKLYSSKTGEWRVFGDDPWYPLPRYHQAVFTGGKRVYLSFGKHITWFDVEREIAGMIECPDKGSDIRVHPYGQPYYTNIGVCDGELSYSNLTREGEIEIWSEGQNIWLQGKILMFVWVKKHTVSLPKVFKGNWNVVSRICKKIKISNRKKAARFLAHRSWVSPLPYSGGEHIWFTINLDDHPKVFLYNLRTKELKSIKGDILMEYPFFPFIPTLLPCPT